MAMLHLRVRLFLRMNLYARTFPACALRPVRAHRRSLWHFLETAARRCSSISTSDPPPFSPSAGRAHGAPWETTYPAVATPSEEDVESLAGVIAASERGAIVAGGGACGEEVARLAERAGWPLVAEPHSGARLPRLSLEAPQSL